MKKTAALLMALCLLISALPVTTLAAEGDIFITSVEITSTQGVSLTPTGGMTVGEYNAQNKSAFQVVLKAGDKVYDGAFKMQFGIDKGHGEAMPEDVVLEAGQTYDVNIVLLLLGGGSFSYWDNGDFAGTVTLDGKVMPADTGFCPSGKTDALVMDAFLEAQTGYQVRYGQEAADLWEEGLFLGDGVSFALDKPLTRAAGVTMLVRVLGKDSAAKSGNWTIPFTDVPDWAKPYVGYAYANGLTNGTGPTTFSSDNPMTATEYLTLMLRALGYNDQAGDFRWDKAADKALEIGLIGAPCYTEYTTTNRFLRDNAAMISWMALRLNKKGTSTTLRSTITVPGKPSGSLPALTAALAQASATPKPSTGGTDSDFKLTLGKGGSSLTNTYLYAGGRAYAVEYYFTLKAGKGGLYTMTFPISETASDTRTLYTVPGGVYDITYTYGLSSTSSAPGVSYDVLYDLTFAIDGPNSTTLKSKDRHPGTLKKGGLSYMKQGGASVIPEDTLRCNSCNGVGCELCHGNGCFGPDAGGQVCAQCDGTGKITCPECNGEGYKPKKITSAGGGAYDKYAIQARQQAENDKKCPTCNNNLAITCPGCGGDGYR